MVRVQKIRVPDTGHLSWIIVDGEHLPVTVLNEYLLYLHRLGRSPNTVRAYAHHLQAFWAFLVQHGHDWQGLKLTQLAEFVSWVRHATRTGRDHRSDATINLILAAIGSFYEYQDRLGVETAISRSRRYGAKSPYKPFLHHISRTQSLRHAVIRVRAIKRLPRVFSPVEVQSLLDACTRFRDRLLLCLLHESGMRIGQTLGLRHADIRSYDGAIDIVPRANSNGALAKSRSRMWCMSRNRRWLFTRTTSFMNIEKLRTTTLRELVGRPGWIANAVCDGNRSLPATLEEDWAEGNAAHVPSHPCDRPSPSRVGCGLCAAAVGSRAHPDDNRHLRPSVA